MFSNIGNQATGSETPTIAGGRRLATLVHISDLHFGVPSAEDGAPPPANWRRHVPLMDGFLGHHAAAIDHLTHFMNVLRASEADPVPLVVVSGDLTACGKVEEFDRAKMFLQASYDVQGFLYGLKESDVLERTIPGNHDQWPGTRAVKGPRTSGFATTFRQMPFLFERTLPGGQVLQLIGIDTDANVDANGRQRRWARGSFVDQIDRLDNDVRFSAPKGHEIRVLLMHHSPANQSYKLGIDGRSRRALRNWIHKAGISVILTGHMHKAFGDGTAVSTRGKKWTLVEARSGTTTQLDAMPAIWAAKGTLFSRRLPLNSLLVHRLVEKDGRILWNVEYCERLHDGFESRQSLPGRLNPTFAVWPR
jgi:3',5'-cyclic AMP phosphodiesterase CpdA